MIRSNIPPKMPDASKDDRILNNSAPPTDLTMKGDFGRYDSAFLKLLLPFLSSYRLWIAAEEINPKNIFQKPPKLEAWTKPKGFLQYAFSRNIKAYGMGATVLALLSFYSKCTADDIKTLSAEAVGYELGKRKEDVGLYDVFCRSRNPAINVVSHDFIGRSLARLGAAVVPFFIPWEKLRGYPESKPKYGANLDMGVGIAGLYLTADGLMRRQTFFEAEQAMVNKLINHVDANINEIIQPGHIQSLLLLHRKRENKSYKWPLLASQEAKNEVTLSGRIADLLNQTYNNTPDTEHTNFTIGKFNYLVGFGLLDKFPQSLAFVELANKSSDMREVKAAAAAIKNGQDPAAVFQSFGIDINNPVKQHETIEPAREKFVDNRLQKGKIVARSLMDYAEISNDCPFVGGKA